MTDDKVRAAFVINAIIIWVKYGSANSLTL